MNQSESAATTQQHRDILGVCFDKAFPLCALIMYLRIMHDVCSSKARFDVDSHKFVVGRGVFELSESQIAMEIDPSLCLYTHEE